MDLDDDSLDDLLRDTSANKFKKSEPNIVPEDLLTNPPLNSRKEKKSALLAELFGPSSTTSFSAVQSSFEDQERTAEKNASTTNLSTILSTEGKKVEDFKFGSYVPSAVKSSLGQPSRPASSGSLTHQTNNNLFQPPVFSFEKITAEKKNVTLDSFVNEGSPKQLSSFKIESSSPVRPQIPLLAPDLPEIKAAGWNNTHNQNSAQQGDAPISGNQKTEISSSQAIIPFTFNQLPNSSLSKVAQGEITNLTVIKEVLENFTSNFCDRLETLTKKNEGLSEVTDCLGELHKCISTASQNWLSAPDRNNSGEFDKKILILESRIESISHENSNLRKQLEFVENQLRENRNETSKIKLETESIVEINLKWMKEALSNLENKISDSHSQQSTNKQAVEEANSNTLRLINEKMVELESKLVKNSAGQQEETLHLLKAEIKWLERQKGKLKSHRKELQVLENQIQGKLKLLDGLSAELVSRTLAVETRTRKMEQEWAKILKKEEELCELQRDISRHHHVKNSEQIEDLGLALWKLHVKGDEQKLVEQHNFLQMLNKTVI